MQLNFKIAPITADLLILRVMVSKFAMTELNLIYHSDMNIPKYIYNNLKFKLHIDDDGFVSNSQQLTELKLVQFIIFL
jgi:hypothetical protein